MKFRLMLIVILVSFLLSIQIALLKGQERITMPAQNFNNQVIRTYTFNTYEITRSPDEYKLPWIKVETAGINRLNNNRFIIPKKIELIAIPPNAAVYFRITEKSCSELPIDEISSPLHIQAKTIPLKEFPAEVIQTGKQGFLRYQAFQELIINPIIYKDDKVQFCSKFTIEVTWQGGWIGYQRMTLNEPLFENVYQNSFVNYEQGMHYRAKKITGAMAYKNLALPFPGLKIKVKEDGIYRITFQNFKNAGIVIENINTKTVQVFNKGKEIAIYIKGEADGVFNENDYLEFYGQKMTPNPASPDEFEGGDYTDENIYWLYFGRAIGKRMTLRNVAPTHNYSVPVNYWYSEEFHPWGSFYYKVWNAGMHHWVWASEVKACPEPCFDNSFCHPPTTCPPEECGHGWRKFPVQLPAIDPDATEQSNIVVKLQPRTIGYQCEYDDHHSIIEAGSSSPECTDSQYWNSGCPPEVPFHNFYHDFNVPNTCWTQPTAVTLRLPGDVDADVSCADRTALESIKVTYKRLFDAVDNAIDFRFQNGDWRFIISNFQKGLIYGYDITNPELPVMLTGYVVNSGLNSTSNLIFEDSIGSSNRYILITDAVAKKPVSMVRDVPSYWKTAGHRVDYLIITDKTFINKDALIRLVQWKEARGYKVAVVDSEDIFDEFNYGIFDPKAIKSFLQHVFYFWKEPIPQFVLFVGDPTFDYKNKRGNPDWYLYTPTWIGDDIVSNAGIFSSDSMLATVNGNDLLPEYFAGRISVHNEDDLRNVVNKIVQYESLSPSEYWAKRITMVADSPAYGEEAIEFSQNMAKDRYLATPPYEVNKLYYCYYRNKIGCYDFARMNRSIKKAFNDGTVIFSYAGHGSPTSWGRYYGIFWQSSELSNDFASLTNYNRYPLLINSSCFTASIYRDKPPGKPGELGTAFYDVLMETAVNIRDKGVIAGMASSSFDSVNGVWIGTLGLYDSIFALDKKDNVVGSIFYAMQVAYYENGLLNEFAGLMLIGDPSIHLITPVAQEPRELTAIPDDQKVTLTWNAPQDSILGYNVYRCACTDPPACDSCNAPLYNEEPDPVPCEPYPPPPPACNLLDTSSFSGIDPLITSQSTILNSEMLNYQLINPQLITGNSYEDTGLTNGIEYYYHVVAKDRSGFDSKWSNLATAIPIGPICSPSPSHLQLPTSSNE